MYAHLAHSEGESLFLSPHNHSFRSYQGARFRKCVSKGDCDRYSDSCRTVVPIFSSFLIAALYQGRESFLQNDSITADDSFFGR